MQTLKKKYGIWTATALVVGVVIGSGVFFKAPKVLKITNGSLTLALLAWLIGGLIMIVSAYVFSLAARKIGKANGIVDYMESAYGETAGYLTGWFITFIYYPSLASVLAWVSGMYTTVLLQFDDSGYGVTTWAFACLYLFAIFLLNYYSPELSGKWQVSTTVVKLIPLGLVAIVGTVSGLYTGQTIANFTSAPIDLVGGNIFFQAILATAFAYEGWILVTSINAELKDAKKNLPKALVYGTIFIVIIYMLYYIGFSGAISNSEAMELGDGAVLIVVQSLFGNFAGTILTVFVIISCLGTLNGVVMAESRGLYSIASRNLGPMPKFFRKINPSNDVTTNSALAGFILILLWLVFWYNSIMVWFGISSGWWPAMDSSELPIAILYGIYIGVYIWVMRTFKELNIVKRFILPSLAIIGSLVILYGAFNLANVWLFLGIATCIMIISLLFNKKTL
ncbi:APC family permease [Mycoplasmatota bacterium WC44]